MTDSIEQLLEPLRAEPRASAILSDLDGTLAPIVDDPAAAAVPPEAQDLLARLADTYALVGCITGRRALDARRLAGVDGLLYAGNRVDISPSFKIKNDGSVDGCTQPYILRTQTILQNVQVLSVGQQQQKPAGANNTGASDSNSGVSGTLSSDAKQQPGASTITLALSPDDSLKLASAQERAKTVWTSLRADGDTKIRDIAPSNACVYE